MKKIFILSFTAILMAGCSIIDAPQTTLPNNVEGQYEAVETGNGYHIDFQEALSNLERFIAGDTKSVLNIESQIENVFYIFPDETGMHERQSLGMDISEESDVLLYVVNFKDNSGSAVLSADRRLPVDLYAVTEQGNFTIDDAYDENSPLSLIRTSSNGGIIDDWDNPGIDTSYHLINPDDRYDNGEWSHKEYGSWVTSANIPVMLKTTWGQGSPYNDRIRRAAGCSTTALAQIITYNQYPPQIDGEQYPYSGMGCTNVILPGSIFHNFVSRLFYAIYINCNPTCLGDETLIWPKDIASYMQELGYNNVSLYQSLSDFNTNLVYQGLSNGYPVFVAAKANGFNAHSWVVDGYLSQSRSWKEVGDKSGRVYNTGSESRILLHCNWGWDGDYNGYFYSGIFTSRSPVISDSSIRTMSESTGEYDSYYRIITYDIP